MTIDKLRRRGTKYQFPSPSPHPNHSYIYKWLLFLIGSPEMLQYQLLMILHSPLGGGIRGGKKEEKKKRKKKCQVCTYSLYQSNQKVVNHITTLICPTTYSSFWGVLFFGPIFIFLWVTTTYSLFPLSNFKFLIPYGSPLFAQGSDCFIFG